MANWIMLPEGRKIHFQSGFLLEENKNIHPSSVANFYKACLVNQNQTLASNFWKAQVLLFKMHFY